MFTDVTQLLKIAPHTKREFQSLLTLGFLKYFPEYEINTKLRECHFLAQAAHEADGFKTMQEYASGKAYEGRKDLGNTNPGDGVRYKGRGIFQLTGRANYKSYGERLNLDLINYPELASDPGNAIHIACEYWKSHGLNIYADKDDIRTITKKINGGYNGLKDREVYLIRAKNVL